MDNSGLACIADFGLAKITQNMDSIWGNSSPHGFTMRWAAPELMIKGEYSKKADIFSFAMVMIEVCCRSSTVYGILAYRCLSTPQIFTGAVPFCDSFSVVAIMAMAKGRRPPRPTHPLFTEDLWTLMRRCWDDDPELRPKASEILQTLRTLSVFRSL